MPRRSLTEKEIEIMCLLAKTYDNQKICDALNITMSTLNTHMKNIHLKLGTLHIRELMAIAIKHFGENGERA